MLTREAQLLIIKRFKNCVLYASKLCVYELNPELHLMVGVELAHAKSAASNY
ncbi:hypothetical protein PCARR_a0242 [Pseudoalteromonas carrageenovora IAM 12662]|uniref:Transposase n=1 Tax=Pseudoalteromonas carrageenovora IAM 12662 TaxID=1314868 RepID=A0ABR9ERW9_PSEVC|nr:hypothetical protein [Pseudoalteromonas carrageenovora IAM 12662]